MQDFGLEVLPRRFRENRVRWVSQTEKIWYNKTKPR